MFWAEIWKISVFYFILFYFIYLFIYLFFYLFTYFFFFFFFLENIQFFGGDIFYMFE